MERPIRVSLLGPTEVLVGDEMTPIAGTKLQSLVALLALAVPHPVADGRLVDELWGDAQPARAANALQALVSHLRRLLGRSEVVRRGSGYALAIDPDEVDAIRLERLVRRAREESRRGAHGSAADRSARRSSSSAANRSPSWSTGGSHAMRRRGSRRWSSRRKRD